VQRNLPKTAEPVQSALVLSPVEEAPVRLTILGATGSVGQSTLDVVNAAPAGYFEVEALSANDRVDELAMAARRCGAKFAVIANEQRDADLKAALSGTDIEVAAGLTGLDEAADRDADCVMAAIVGAAGMRPALRAGQRAGRLAIANKECLVIAGELFLAEMERAGTEVLPVDSEHAAVFQVLEGRDPATVAKVVLTASGGPFRDWPVERMASVTLQDALKHPNWSMGDKISVDSATMMNKGLELIEAAHLFSLEFDRLDAIVHPQSLVHSLVEFCDGSTMAQLAALDMRVPIAQSLYWPVRRDCLQQPFDWKSLSQLDFKPVDSEKYPAFGLARAAMQRGGAAPAVLNGANEAAVAAFLDERLAFLDIATTVAKTMDKAEQRGLFVQSTDIDAALAADAEARELARDVMATLC